MKSDLEINKIGNINSTNENIPKLYSNDNFLKNNYKIKGRNEINKKINFDKNKLKNRNYSNNFKLNNLSLQFNKKDKNDNIFRIQNHISVNNGRQKNNFRM